MPKNFNSMADAFVRRMRQSMKRERRTAKLKKHPVTGCRMDTVYGDWLVVANVLEQWRDTAWAILTSGELKQTQAKSNALAAALDQKPFQIQDGIVRMSISGPMTKFDTSMSAVMGGTSTVRMREALRSARALKAENKAQAVFIDIHTEGGTVEGTAELAASIRKTAKVMPVYVHSEDKAASAGLWVATQGTRFTCGPAAIIGSLGAAAELVDASALGKKGILKPFVVASGKFKMIGAPGRSITTEQRAELQRRVDSLADVFKTEVQTARNMTKAQIDDASTARVYIGKEAVKIGLCDSVCTTDEAWDYARAHMNENPQPVKRGPGKGNQKPAANDRSPIMDWTEAQLSELQTLAGDTVTVTADNADRVSYRLAKKLAQRNQTLKQSLEKAQKGQGKTGAVAGSLDPAILRERVEMAVERVQLAMDKKGWTAAQAQGIFSAFLAAGKVDMKTGKLSDDAQPIEALFAKLEDGSFPYQKIIAAIDNGKPVDLGKSVAKDQPAPRDIPGDDGQDKTFAFDNMNTPITLESANKLRVQNGLPPYTADQFRAAFPEVKVA